MSKGLYRTIETNYWKDTKIVDRFTKDDTYFYLYLLTNPNTNLCGCYEISKKQIEVESKMTQDEINLEINNLTKLDVISYSKESSEILLKNVPKHNWTSSADYLSGVCEQLKEIKNRDFLLYLVRYLICQDTVSNMSIEGLDNIDTSSIDSLYTMVDSIRNSIRKEKKVKEKDSKAKKPYNPSTKDKQDISKELRVSIEKVNDTINYFNECGLIYYSKDELIENIKNTIHL